MNHFDNWWTLTVEPQWPRGHDGCGCRHNPPHPPPPSLPQWVFDSLQFSLLTPWCHASCKMWGRDVCETWWRHTWWIQKVNHVPSAPALPSLPLLSRCTVAVSSLLLKRRSKHNDKKWLLLLCVSHVYRGTTELHQYDCWWLFFMQLNIWFSRILIWLLVWDPPPTLHSYHFYDQIFGKLINKIFNSSILLLGYLLLEHWDRKSLFSGSLLLLATVTMRWETPKQRLESFRKCVILNFAMSLWDCNHEDLIESIVSLYFFSMPNAARTTTNATKMEKSATLWHERGGSNSRANRLLPRQQVAATLYALKVKR